MYRCPTALQISGSQSASVLAWATVLHPLDDAARSVRDIVPVQRRRTANRPMPPVVRCFLLFRLELPLQEVEYFLLLRLGKLSDSRKEVQRRV